MYPTRNDFAPTDVAVKNGRFVFYVVGGIIVAVPVALAAVGVAITTMIELLVFAVGIGLIILGRLLPPKTVAHFGFNLPLALPNVSDDD